MVVTSGPLQRRRIRKVLALADFEPLARRHLPHPLFEYLRGGAETNQARDGNRAAFAKWRFLPHVLRDVWGRGLSTTLMGRGYSAPFGIAPMGISALTACGAICASRSRRASPAFR